ncbi:Ldh family oxidoreductase [Gellertiella hungarica]|uniref:LDH2 family malate/lactate/ureidoglycolate dehydrogenase n=1 Tax=Gellertiella hungarica TaxID=1572859 RepID=A0A7W6J7T8_9HYPH|nr:Ldh family oxidoreductase [Gellertiella hungarica]MBB4066327.1 LDH2 family malate/lactate/ureidoglycolate dehydrogenase [Gellertiella hungarica]
MPETVTLSFDEAEHLATQACLVCGSDGATAETLAHATLDAHRHGRHEVGLPHLLDYLHAMKAGRLNGRSNPRISHPFPAWIAADADGGIAQLPFGLALDQIAAIADSLGIAIFTQRNSFTTGELGYYARQLAYRGLACLAFTNANAMVTPQPGCAPVFSTNPLAFAFPQPRGLPPVVIDQSSSATAFVNVIAAAARGEDLPEGFAVDAEGVPTCDPRAALKGALLPFGGRKGANMALLVELMSAGISGGDWSTEAGDFRQADGLLDTGLTVIAFKPGTEPEVSLERSRTQIESLARRNVYIPGRKGASSDLSIDLDAPVYRALSALAAGG